jgi:D-alanyl-lipoteichoic acid acyltransferase DltB (MBOAT superfamily)
VALTSPSFIAFFLAVALLVSALPAPGGRSLVLLGANLVFIGSYLDHAGQIVPFAAFRVLTYHLIEIVRRRRTTAALWAALALTVAAFVVLKKYTFLPAPLTLPFAYLIIGLSYVLFRVLHLMIDARQGELAQPVPPLHFLNYTCNFLSFIAGPIQRYQDYLRQQGERLALDDGRVFRACARIVKGFVQVGVTSAIFKYLFDTLSERLLDAAQTPPLAVLGGVYVAAAVCYTVYLYANFAGYMDIVIGIGRLLGQDLPENFNRPFQARSFLEFWSRWHMTLSEWFKTYVFNPLLKVLATRYTSPRTAPYLGVAAFFVTFLIMGIWHGTTAAFVVYGLLLGTGASINKLWQVSMTRRLGKKTYQALAERPVSVYLSRGLTLAYFALALSCLWLDMAQLLWLARNIGLFGLVACYLGLAAAAALAFLAWDTVISPLAPVRARIGDASGGVLVRNLALGTQILLIVTVASFFHKAPEFVYRAF